MQQEARHIFHLGLTKNFPRSYANYKSRSISLILIIHVYKCMQIQKAFRQSNNKTFFVHFTHLKKTYMYIFGVFLEIADLILMIFHVCLCMHAHALIYNTRWLCTPPPHTHTIEKLLTPMCSL